MPLIIASTVLAYVAINLIIGYLAHRRAQDDSEDYFIARRSLSWTHLAATLFATWMSTFAFLGSPGFYYQNGVTWFLPHGYLVVASPFLLWFIGRKIWVLGKQGGFITPADLLADFYRSETVRYLVALVSLLALLPYSLIQIVGIGKVLAASTDGLVPYWAGVLLAALAMTFYTYFGGIRAVVWTDLLQAGVFGSIMLLGAGIALHAAGGLKLGFEKAIATRESAFIFEVENIGQPLTLLIIWTFGYILMPHMWQRAYMARSAGALSRTVVTGPPLALFLIVLPSLIMGTLGIGFMSGIGDTDEFVPTMYSTFLPWALPLLVLATFAAGMSTIDSQLLSAASVVTRDLAGSRRSSRDLSAERKFGRRVVVILIAILAFLALSPEGQGNIILLASKGAGIALMLFVPLWGPLFWQRASRISAILSLVFGCLTLLVLEAGIVRFELPLGFGPPIAALLLQILVFSTFNFTNGKSSTLQADGIRESGDESRQYSG